jgi:protein TonB
MRFKAAVILSGVLHASLFALAIWMPGNGGSSETVYRVDLVSLPGGGGSGGKKTNGQIIEETQRMKDLTTQKEPPKSKLRYADPKNKKKSKRKKPTKKKSLISVQKKKTTKKKKGPISVTRKSDLGNNEVLTGISAGGGGGSGGGFGGGTGSGTGTGLGNFPYAYYIEALRSKISASWYNALVSPGLRGRHVVVVYFKILRNGQVMDLDLRKKSGVQTLDLSAYRAVENAAPFPPLPGSFTDRYLGVYFEFIWEKK